MIVGTTDILSQIALPGVLLLALTKVIPYFYPIPDNVYYAVFLVLFIWFVLRGGLKISYTYIPFLTVLFVSIWVNEIPAYFRVWFRVLAFLSVVFLVGPFFINPNMVAWRRLLFLYTLVAIRWIVIISFFAWVFKLPFIYGYSGFHGLTNQSMLLGPLAGISMVYSLYRFYLSSGICERYKQIGIAVISLVVLLLAGSRSALASSVMATAFFYSRIYRHRVERLARLVFMLAILAVLTAGIWWPYTEKIRSKMEGGKIAGSLTRSRDDLWEARVSEFKGFPIFGVGFATVKPDYAKTNKVNRETGTIEPGSSWLFLLSSMGITGFLAFFIPYMSFMYRMFQRESVGINGYFLGSLLFLFFFHLFFEGYVVSSGAYLCFFLWLLLSECSKVINVK